MVGWCAWCPCGKLGARGDRVVSQQGPSSAVPLVRLCGHCTGALIATAKLDNLQRVRREEESSSRGGAGMGRERHGGNREGRDGGAGRGTAAQQMGMHGCC